MKLVKMMTTLALSAALLAGTAAVPVYAAENTTTEFSYVKTNEPTYTVSIPSSLSLSADGTPLDIKAENVSGLDGKKVSVTIQGTNYFRNQLVLSGKTSKPVYTDTIRYQLIAADGNVIETTGEDTVSGKELAAFTDNGIVTYTVKPVLGTPNQNLEPGVNYTGTMTFGIELKEQ